MRRRMGHGRLLRLPAGVGLALNPDSVPGLPLYPECGPFLASLAEPWCGAATVPGGLIGHPPGAPVALLAQARSALAPLAAVRLASAAWLAVPEEGAGLVIAVTLDDTADELARQAAFAAIDRAAAAPAHAPGTAREHLRAPCGERGLVATEFPRPYYTRRMARDGARYFGPYTSAQSLRGLKSAMSEFLTAKTTSLSR